MNHIIDSWLLTKIFALEMFFLSGATIVIVLVCCKNKQTNKKLWWLMFSENSVESGLYQEGKGSVPVKIAVAFVLFMVSKLLNSDSIISYLCSFSVTLFFFFFLLLKYLN